MTTKVYAWPPICALGTEWTRNDPVDRSRSLIDGSDYLTASMRSRRMASIAVSGIDGSEMGAGYMESLKRLLAGRHAVRLYSSPINWNGQKRRDITARQYRQITWENDGTPVTWQRGGDDVEWFVGSNITGTSGADVDGFATITVTGAPANTLIAQPAEYLTIYTDPEQTAQIVAPVVSGADGTGVIKVFGALTAFADARVNIGTQASGVFRPVGPYPRAIRPRSGDWRYDWQFAEIFEDEVDGAFEEVDPWL